MNESKSQISYDQQGLGGVLKHNQLIVPPNQREYAWEDRQVRQLFQDFAKAIADAELGYFLGTIVTIPRLNGTLEVVDGQQRLATTALLLSAIRDYLKGKEDVLVEAINNEFLTGIDRIQRARVPRLKLNVDDNDLFSWLITGKVGEEPHTGRESHERLKRAYDEAKKHVKKIVSTLDVKDHGDILNAWVSFIEHKALVVLLRVPNDANAYKMFETLNDRGLRVSQADLIKNYLFGRSGERINEVQNRWTYMRGVLESLDEENITVDFLRHALIAISGFVREAEVYDKVQELVKGDQGAVSFASTLEVLSNSYVATYNPEHEKWNGYSDSVRRGIEVLNLLNIRPMKPLIVAIAAKLDKKQTADAFNYLVSLGVRLLIASTTRSGSVEQPLAATARAVFNGEIETASDIKKKLAGIMPTDVQFQTAFETARISKTQLSRYFLRSLEMAAKHEPEPWFIPHDDRAIINLEHVLPKKPDDSWQHFSAEEHQLFMTRLGNQVLLRASENSELKSTSFDEKKKVYLGSPYVLTSQIASLASWTPEQINARQKKLAELSLIAWPS